MEEIRRRRKRNFSDDEIKCLLEEIGLQKELIMSKTQTTSTMQQKREAWHRIASSVTAQSGVCRSIDDVKKKWKDLKAETNAARLGNLLPGKRSTFFEVVSQILIGNGNSSDSLNKFETDEGFIVTLRDPSSITTGHIKTEVEDPKTDYVVTLRDPLPEQVKTEVPVIISVQESAVPLKQHEEHADLQPYMNSNVTYVAEHVTTHHQQNSISQPVQPNSHYYNASMSQPPPRQEYQAHRQRNPEVNVNQAVPNNTKRSRLYLETGDGDLLDEYIRSCISRNNKEEELIDLKCKKLRRELGMEDYS